MKKILIIISCLLLTSATLFGANKKLYELDESIDLDELKSKLELFKSTRLVISKNIGSLMNKHKQFKMVYPDLIGQIMMKVVINRQGNITKTKIMSSDINNSEFRQEVLNTVGTWKFGSMSKDKQDLLIPFYFK